MRTLLAVVNARHRDNWRNAVRGSWMKQVPRDKADALFFMGRGDPRQFSNDEVELDCSDKYEHLPEKVQSIARWALEHGYDYMLKCDDDVILRPNDALSSGYDRHDFSGKSNRPPQPYVVSFGFNYWMSKRSMEVIAQSKLPEDGSNDDEKWVAKNLWEHGISLFNVDRYKLHSGWEVYPQHTFHRALRVPRQLQEQINDPYIFSRCIHIEGGDVTQESKIQEFQKVFLKYGEK